MVQARLGHSARGALFEEIIMKTLVALLFICACAPVHAASYFYQFGDSAGGRGYVISTVSTSDGRSGFLLVVNGHVHTLPCASDAIRMDENLALASGSACGPELLSPCGSSVQNGTQTFSSFFANKSDCTNSMLGKCVSVAGEMTEASYLAEAAFLRPVIDRVYERSASYCQ
jgi:hypothetical protein